MPHAFLMLFTEQTRMARGCARIIATRPPANYLVVSLVEAMLDVGNTTMMNEELPCQYL